MPAPLSEQELAAAAEQLPPVTSIIRRLLAVLDNPHSDVDDISRLIRVDTALTAEVLRLANSAHFGFPGGISSIEEAIQHTGVNEIIRVVSTLNARQLSMRPLENYKVSATLLWPHTLAVAVAADVVAERFLADRSAAYLGGLLHPIGLIVLDSIAVARGQPTRSASTPVLEWEKRTFGADNAGISERLLKGWSMPEAVVNAVATRYQPPRPDTIGELKGILYLASAMAERVPAGLPAEVGLFPVTDEILQPFRMDQDEFAELSLAAGQQLSRVRALF